MRRVILVACFTSFILLVKNNYHSYEDADERPFRGYLLRKIKEIIPDVVERWKNFTQEARLALTESENRKRFFIFGKNLIDIDTHNKKKVGFTLAENELVDKGREEYFKMLSVERGPINIENSFNSMTTENTFFQSNFTQIGQPIDRDWRRYKVITKVKAQGSCGSCYAFTMVAVVEAALAIKNRKLEELSEQAIVDCSGSYNNHGCRSGNLQGTLEFLMATRLPTEREYPYRGKQGQCRISRNYRGRTVVSYQRIRAKDEHHLSYAIENQGPVAVAVDASRSSFQFYKSGIYNDPECSSDRLNHGVAAIGSINVRNTHYIIKNSWGTWWGENGYMRLARHRNNMCGIATQAFIPLV